MDCAEGRPALAGRAQRPSRADIPKVRTIETTGRIKKRMVCRVPGLAPRAANDVCPERVTVSSGQGRTHISSETSEYLTGPVSTGPVRVFRDCCGDSLPIPLVNLAEVLASGRSGSLPPVSRTAQVTIAAALFAILAAALLAVRTPARGYTVQTVEVGEARLQPRCLPHEPRVRAL